MEAKTEEPFSICLPVNTWERLLAGLLVVARRADRDRPQLRGVTFDASGGIMASDGHRIHYVDTSNAPNGSARRVVLPLDEARRLAANLPFYRNRAKLTSELVDLSFGGMSASVTIGTDATVPSELIATLRLEYSVGAIPWRQTVPRTDRAPAHTALRSRYLAAATDFIRLISDSMEPHTRIFAGGERDPVVFAPGNKLLEGLKRGAAVVMPVTI